jgi:hypothetical protein
MKDREALPDIDIAAGKDPFLFVKRMVSIAESEPGVTVELGIAEELNARGVPGLRGRPWQGTAIRGHRNRGSGILNNQGYIGRIVFNRLAYRTNPATERRVSRENAAEHHVVQEVPSLRIVDDALWQRVKTRQENWRTS